MVKQVVADVFETLGGVAKSAGQQAVSGAKKAGEDIVEQLGITKATTSQSNEQRKGPTEEQLKKMEQASKKRSISRYKELQAQIKALQEKRKKEIPEQISGKPGFSEEKAVKQLEVKKEAASAEASASQGKKLPPLPVRRESQKAERFRGVSG